MADKNPEVFFWTAAGFCGLVAFYMLSRFLAFARRNRVIQDTPLAHIRSAAQGYVRLQGRAAPPSDKTIAPLTGRPCVWWEYEVAHRHKNAKGETEWNTIDGGKSAAPFTLADTDGQCLIGPVGAEITPTSDDIWYGVTPQPDGPPPEAHHLLTLERDYRYTERLIAPGAHLAVLGEFASHSETLNTDERVRILLDSWKRDQVTLLQKFDRDGDGHLDAEEWEAARAAARAEVEAKALIAPIQRVSVVGQPKNGEPFLIAPLNEQQLVHRERRYAVVALILSVLFATLAVWAIHAALGVVVVN
jgi:hypothetical protein